MFISNNINILIEIQSNLKYEEKIKRDKEIEDFENLQKTLAEQYEELLIKAENDIRKHIKVSNINFNVLYHINS